MGVGGGQLIIGTEGVHTWNLAVMRPRQEGRKFEATLGSKSLTETRQNKTKQSTKFLSFEETFTTIFQITHA